MFTTLPLGVELGLIIATIISLIILYKGFTYAHFIKVVITYVVSILLLLSIVSLGKKLYISITYPVYEATIVSLAERKQKDDEGDVYYLYAPTYAFHNGVEELNVESSVATSGLEIGERLYLGYKDGDFLEYTIATVVLIVFLLIASVILSFILYMIIATIFKREMKHLKEYGSFVVKAIIFLFLGLIGIGIVRQVWLYYLDEVAISATMMFALSVMLFIIFWVLLTLMFSKGSMFEEEEKEAKEEENRKDIEKLQELDMNMGLMYGVLFITFIFSMISLTQFMDQGISFFAVLFGLISLGGSIFAFYFFLAYQYFKSAILTLLSQVKNGKMLKGTIHLKQKVMRSTTFMFTLKNTHEVTAINSEGEEYDKTKSIWEIEKEVHEERNSNGVKIPFEFHLKDFKKGKLVLKITAKTKWINLSRSYTLGEKQ